MTCIVSSPLWRRSTPSTALLRRTDVLELYRATQVEAATDYLNDLLDFAWEGYFERLFPGVDKPTFDPSAMQDIVDWIHGDDENMIFLYGTHDPFFAARVGLDGDDEARDRAASNPGVRGPGLRSPGSAARGSPFASSLSGS